MDRAALAEFLRRRREALRPEDLGIESGRRRRTVGLRREEVARAAYMSTDFYARLEQARGSRPSAETTAALARALRLNPIERAHLYELAGHTPPPRAHRTEHPDPGLLRVLGRLDTPAQIVSDLGVTVAQNDLARALVGDQTQFVGPSRSAVYRWFTDPESRQIHPEDEHADISRDHVGALRAVHGAPREDPEADELVNLLLEGGGDFAELWQRHEVGTRASGMKTFVNPLVGTVRLDCQILTAGNEAERLVVFAPAPGSEDADKIELLAVVGGQQFAT
jgi:transcriptional regulator with XRE-family HTH domain